MKRGRAVGLGLGLALVVVAISGCGSSNGPVVRAPVTTASSSTASSSTASSSTASSSTASSSATSAPTTKPVRPPHPTTAVKPAIGLHAGQQVTVVATGFSPGLTLLVVQCADKGQQTGAGDCNLTAAATVHTDATGSATTPLTVTPGPFGSNGIVCSAKLRCLISVTQASPNPTEEADAPIRFG